MLPKFANPHSLSQDAEMTTRSDIAKRAGCTCVVDDKESHSLKHDLDNLLQEIWADVYVQTLSPPRAKKRRRTKEGRKNEDNQLVFRLVSSMKRPQHISLDPRPPPPTITREPECEDSEQQAEVRRIRAQSVAVDFKALGETDALMRQIYPKPVTKIPLNTPLLRQLPPLLALEEVRATKRVEARHSETNDVPAASPHEPRPSCVVLPVKSISNNGGLQRKEHRKVVKDRPAPAYWRPPPDTQGKSLGYAYGYPSSWAADQLHHHKTYVGALNATENNYAKAATPKERIALQSAIRFNGGGQINHSLFWKNLAPAPDGTHVKGNGGVLKDGPLKDAIKHNFGTVEDFIKEFNSITTAIQSSGWGWLGWNPGTSGLGIITTANQDPLLTHVPIIGVDAWEHAYYLQYFSARATYLEKIWNVINWEEGEKRFDDAVAGSKL